MDEHIEHLKIAKDLTLGALDRMGDKETVTVEKMVEIFKSFMDCLHWERTRPPTKIQP